MKLVIPEDPQVTPADLQVTLYSGSLGELNRSGSERLVLADKPHYRGECDFTNQYGQLYHKPVDGVAKIVLDMLKEGIDGLVYFEHEESFFAESPGNRPRRIVFKGTPIRDVSRTDKIRKDLMDICLKYIKAGDELADHSRRCDDEFSMALLLDSY